jgi:2-oxoglutarate dehydrogenase E2 component (dihydrolipoamide succinyltransferase)
MTEKKSHQAAQKEIKVPAMGESITEATIARWLKKEGESVTLDEPLVELETDKVTLEVGSPATGTLTEVLVHQGDTVEIGTILGRVTPGEAKISQAQPQAKKEDVTTPSISEDVPLSPSVKRLVAESGLDPLQMQGHGKGGRLTKGDVLTFMDKGKLEEEESLPQAKPAKEKEKRVERVRLSKLRQRIAERLKEAQNTAAILTTFNEADMTNIIALRTQLKESFEKRHGTRLGFMSFFVKAAIVALKEIPAVNAEIEGDELIYKNYYDIGVAVGTPQGLVVPVVRDADKKSFAQIEKDIASLGQKARDGKLALQDLQGGTFTISNGGLYGSLMSTPILNPPQSGILGMHKIQERPVAIEGKVEIRPMMYLALSYDHRIIDGKEAVTFLVRIKECIENPERILLDV